MTELAALLESSSRIAFFTGAGASTEPPSSLPDFRSATGLWRDRTLVETLTRGTFFADPEGFWETFREVFMPWTRALPNAVHQAPARLARMGKLLGVVTQNIDGLDVRCASGYPVYELHGHLRSSTCPSCGKRVKTEDLPAGVPRCGCGRVLKPDVVLFDDPLDFEDVFEPAQELLSQADLVVVVGTSLSVFPANTLVLDHADRMRVAVLNRTETPLDGKADFVHRGPAGEALDAALRSLEAAART